MSGSSLTASEVMDRSAALLNDPAKTDYTYIAQLPYINMAIDELFESLEESNVTITNQTAAYITLPVGMRAIIREGWQSVYPVGTPLLPIDVMEIQEVSERLAGSSDVFVKLTKKEFINDVPATSAFLFWSYQDQVVNFNLRGATTPRQIKINYVTDYGMVINAPTDQIYVVNARSFLSYKTAALCAQFIGENQERAQLLEGEAQRALERLLGISNKGNQQVMTRHRPFRASFKARGGF